jgi:hypothetical protein
MPGKGARELVVEVAVVRVMVTVAVSDLVIVVMIVSVAVVVTCPVPNVLVHALVVVLIHVLVVYETPMSGGPTVHTAPLEEIRHRNRMDRTDNTRPYIADLLLELGKVARVNLHLHGFATQSVVFRFIRVDGTTTPMVSSEYLKH